MQRPSDGMPQLSLGYLDRRHSFCVSNGVKTGNIAAMLCSSGKELKRLFELAARDLTEADKALADATPSFVLRDQRFQRAQKNHKLAGNAFLDHKANCATCRSRDSGIRPRVASTL